MADKKFVPPSLDTDQGLDEAFKPPPVATDSTQPEPPGVLERTFNAAGGQGVVDAFKAITDPAARERTGKRVAGIVEGIKQEPGRVLGEVQKIGSNVASGNYLDAMENVGRAVPFLGAPTVGIAQDLSVGQYPEAIGHAAQTYGPFAAKYLPKPIEAAAEGGRITRDAAVGAYRGATERVPMGKMYGIDFGETQVPASLKWGAAFGLPGEGLGLARGSATSGIPAAALGAAIPAVRGAYRGVKAGRAARSGLTSTEAASAGPLASVDELSQSLAGKKFQNLSAGEQQQITNIQTKLRQRNIAEERPDVPLPPRDPNAVSRSPYEMVRDYLKERRKPRGSVVERNPAWKSQVPEAEGASTPQYTRPPATEVSRTGRAPGGPELGEYLSNQPRPTPKPALWQGLVPESTPTVPEAFPAITGELPSGRVVGGFREPVPPTPRPSPAWQDAVPAAPDLPRSAFSPSPFSEPIIPSQPFRRATPRAESPGAFDALVKAARKKRKSK